jgi:hypothetical protein
MRRAVLVALVATALSASPSVAATPSPVTAPSPSATTCLRTLKFNGALYLDADSAVPVSEVGPQVGSTDPNPAHCGLPDRLPVYRHVGHNSSAEVVSYLEPGRGEVFRSAGSTGFPFQSVLRWLVLLLVVGILLFAALPAIVAHLRQPPVEVGTDDQPPD